METNMIPVNRIGWIHGLGPLGARQTCEALGFPVTPDGWVSGGAMDAVKLHVEKLRGMDSESTDDDPELSVWMRLWNRMTRRQKRALNRRFSKQLDEQTADVSE